MTEDRGHTNNSQEPALQDDSPQMNEQRGGATSSHAKSTKFLTSLSVAATVGSAIAAFMSAWAAHELLSISELQHQQEVKRIEFYSYVTEADNRSIRLVQVAGKTVAIDTADVVPFFPDDSNNTRQGKNFQ